MRRKGRGAPHGIQSVSPCLYPLAGAGRAHESPPRLPLARVESLAGRLSPRRRPTARAAAMLSRDSRDRDSEARMHETLDHASWRISRQRQSGGGRDRTSSPRARSAPRSHCDSRHRPSRKRAYFGPSKTLDSVSGGGYHLLRWTESDRNGTLAHSLTERDTRSQ